MERISTDLIKLEVELVNTGSVFIVVQNVIDCLKAVLSEDWQTLDDNAKGSNDTTKKKLNNEEEVCIYHMLCNKLWCKHHLGHEY